MEYWLQKKTIGGWLHVTSYQELEQAQRNYASCVGNGMSGYCWRLVECNVIKEDMINDVVEIPTTEPEPIAVRSWGQPSPDAPKSVVISPTRAWGDFKAPINPGADTGLSDKLPPDQQADVNAAWGNFKTCNTVGAKHGLAGSVWVIHHQLRQKSRIPSSELDSYLNKGYIRGGPRTQFE